jgi:hypothetical protein
MSASRALEWRASMGLRRAPSAPAPRSAPRSPAARTSPGTACPISLWERRDTTPTGVPPTCSAGRTWARSPTSPLCPPLRRSCSARAPMSISAHVLGTRWPLPMTSTATAVASCSPARHSTPRHRDRQGTRSSSTAVRWANGSRPRSRSPDAASRCWEHDPAIPQAPRWSRAVTSTVTDDATSSSGRPDARSPTSSGSAARAISRSDAYRRAE